MANEKEKAELKAIDEEGGAGDEVIRLHAEGASENPGRRSSGEEGEGKLTREERRGMKMRSVEPNVDQLLGRREVVTEEGGWQKPNRADGVGRRFRWGWAVVAGIVFFVGVVWLVVQLNRSAGQREELAGEADQILEKEQTEEREAAEVIAAIEAAVRGFLDAVSVEEMMRNVRHPGRVGPLMTDYYTREPLVSFVLEEITALQPLTMDNRAVFWGVGCRVTGGGYEQMLVEVGEDRSARVDWETFVTYQPMDWDEFVKSRPEGYSGEFRVNVTNDNFFSHEFSDGERLLSLRLSTLHGGRVLFGYVEKGSSVGLAILDVFEESGKEEKVPMILELRVPEDVRSPSGVEVMALRAKRWIYIESPRPEDQ